MKFEEKELILHNYQYKFLDYVDESVPEVYETLKSFLPKYKRVFGRLGRLELRAAFNCIVTCKTQNENYILHTLNGNIRHYETFPLIPSDVRKLKNFFDFRQNYFEFIERFGLETDWLIERLFFFLSFLADAYHKHPLSTAVMHKIDSFRGKPVLFEFDGWKVTDESKDFERNATAAFNNYLHDYIKETACEAGMQGYKKFRRPRDYERLRWLGALFQNLMLTDPYNRRLDKGNSFADQRHTFVMSLVARPKFNFENKTLRYLFNHNQVGIIATANSGETFNIVSTSDINGDGTSSDRPIGIKRNSGKTPPQYNADLRYSRFFNFTERYKFEVFAEFQNLFNINSIVGFNNVTVATNAGGELIGTLPDFKASNKSTSQDSRQFQMGFKFIF